MIVCFGMAGFSEENYILGNIDQVKLTVISWMSCPRTNPISFYMHLFISSIIQVSRAWNLISFCCEKQKQNHNNKTFGAEKKEYVKQTWVEERVTERENTITRMRICSEPQKDSDIVMHLLNTSVLCLPILHANITL